jgi:hypothetical protein
MPVPQFFPGAFPTQWPQVPPPQPLAFGGVPANAGTTPFYGRTSNQVEAQGRVQAFQQQDIAREATRQWKPNARPEDFFWVWNAERTFRMLLSFGTIESFNDGGVWHTDEAGIAYYVRGQAV